MNCCANMCNIVFAMIVFIFLTLVKQLFLHADGICAHVLAIRNKLLSLFFFPSSSSAQFRHDFLSLNKHILVSAHTQNYTVSRLWHVTNF